MAPGRGRGVAGNEPELCDCVGTKLRRAKSFFHGTNTTGNHAAAGSRAWERTPRSITYSSFPAALAFHNRNVAVDGQLRKTSGFFTGVRPLHFDPINLFSLAQAQHHARIMRRKITSSAHFPRVPQQISRLIS